MSYLLLPDDPDRTQAHRVPDEDTEKALSLYLPEDLPGAVVSSTLLAGKTHQALPQDTSVPVCDLGAEPRVDSVVFDDQHMSGWQSWLKLRRRAFNFSAPNRADRPAVETGGDGTSTESWHQREERNERIGEVLQAIENRLGPLEAVLEMATRTHDRLTSLSQLAEEVRHRGAALEAQKTSIDRGLVEATRTKDLLTGLEARMTSLTVKEAHLLRSAEEAVGQIERRAAGATADLERRVSEFEAHKLAGAHALDEATRVTAVLSALDARVVTLTAHDQPLGRAEAAVEQIERRAAEAVGRLEQISTEKETLERELANIRQQLRMLTESARYNMERLADHQRPSVIPASLVAPSSQTRKASRSVQPWAAALTGVAALALLGTVVPRWRDRPASVAGIATAAQRESASSRPAALPSRDMDSGTLSPPENVSAGASSTSTVDHAALTSQPTSRPGALHAAFGAAGGSAAARSEKPPRTPETFRSTASAKDTVQEFIGELAITSVPTGAEVFINQQLVGKTPLELNRMPIGSHVVRIEHPGYERWTSAVMVPASKRTDVRAELQPVRDD